MRETEAKRLRYRAFMVVAAVMLAAAAVMAVGAGKAYAKEADEAEAKQTHTVSFVDWYPPAEVETGQTVPKPEPLSDRNVMYEGKERPAKFIGWIDSRLIDPDTEQNIFCTTTANSLVDNLLFRFNEALSEDNGDITLYPVFGCRQYLLAFVIELPSGAVDGLGHSVLANSTPAESEHYDVFQNVSTDPEGRSVEPGTEPWFLPGYIFEGWFDESGARFESDTPIVQDTRLTARFQWTSSDPEPEKPSIPVEGDTGIKANGVVTGMNVPPNAAISLSASAVTSGSDYNALLAQAGKGTFAGAYEINLFVNGKQFHNGFGKLTFSFPIAEQYNGHWVTIWHRHADGSITSERVLAQDGRVSITVTDLSAFALEIEGKPSSGEDPVEPAPEGPTKLQTASSGNGASLAATGDSAQAAVALILAAIVSAAGCALGLRKVRG